MSSSLHKDLVAFKELEITLLTYDQTVSIVISAKKNFSFMFLKKLVKIKSKWFIE